jgi:hypothetical protein
LKDFFPDFFWVIRDAFLLTTVDGINVTPKEYLLNLLHVDLTGFEDDPQKAIKQTLTACFKSIDMDCIPIPHQDAEIVRFMDVQSDDSLSKDFIPALKRVIERSISNTDFTKSISKDSRLDGTAFAAVVEKLVESVNTPGNIPSFQPMWLAVINNIFNQATEACAALYRKKMEGEIAKFPMEISELSKLHKSHFDAALNEFKQKVSNYLPEDVKQRYDTVQKVIAYDSKTNYPIGGVYFEFFVKNQNRSKDFCKTVADKIFTELKQKIHSPNYKFNDFVQDSKKAFDEYTKKAKGPASEEFRASLQILLDGEKQFIEKLNGFSEKKAKEMQQQEEEFRKQLEKEKAKNVQNDLIVQMMEDNRKATEILQENMKVSMERMQEESKRNQEQQAKQFEVLLKTQGEQAANQLQLVVGEMNKQSEAFFLQMSESAANNSKAIGEMVQAIKNIPPPQIIGN